MHDFLLKGGRVVDPANGIDGVFDVAVGEGRIRAVEQGIPCRDARTVIELGGRIVTPGLIDAHCHPVLHFTDHAVHPDEAGANAGVLLVNDGGSAGPANFEALVEMYGAGDRTAMTYFVNVAAAGLIRTPEIRSSADVDAALLEKVVNDFRPYVKGLKIRALETLIGIEPDPIDTALRAAEKLGLPLMVHIGDFRLRREYDPLDAFGRSVVRRLRKGDIVSHYMTWRPGGMVLADGTIYPELREARKRGVLLDCSHGRNNFSLKVAEVLLANGLGPDLITTDLAMVGAPYVQSLLVTMSKFLDLGMPLSDVVAATTSKAASALGIAPDWGNLTVGSKANISVLELVEGEFVFMDGAAGNRRKARRLLEPRLAMREGKPLPVRSFYSMPGGECAS